MNDSRLVPVRGIRVCLRYAIDGLPGAVEHAFLAEQTYEQLLIAQKKLRSRGAELVIWDAYRTPETQQAIFDAYLGNLRESRPDATEAVLHDLARQFVSDPTTVFPHGTGGTVDLTIAVNGALAEMGTDFDEFVLESSLDWFRMNPPRTLRENLACKNREILRDAMESADFVGLSSEWWHFEWGTQRWSEVKYGS